MSYRDFTLEAVASTLGVTTQQATLFAGLRPVPVPAWLQDNLAKRTQLALISEKARSEFIVAPILLAIRELTQGQVAIFSGQRLDVDPNRGLVGECDFILALAPPVPPLRSPIMAIVEAKKNDIEAGLGQCIAQMVAADEFNRAGDHARVPMFGCVTTGEAWQFLRLGPGIVQLDDVRRYLDNVGEILAAFLAITSEARAVT